MPYVRARFLCKIFFAIGLLATCLYGQNEVTHSDEGSSSLFVEAFAFASDQPGKGRLDIYIQIPYPEISFLKEEDQYTGRFEVSATILSQENQQQVWQKSQFVELHVKDFSQTVSHRLFSLKQFSADLAPGKYDLLMQVTNQESKTVKTVKRPVGVKDFGIDSIALSDVMMVRRLTVEGGHKNIVPNLTGMMNRDQTSFYLFFEIYHRTQLDDVTLACTFINSKREIVARQTKRESITGSRTQVIWQLDTLPLPPDQYVLEVEAAGISKTDSGKSIRASVRRMCTVRMRNMPLMITDIEKATDELLYIAKGSEIDFIKDAPTQEEKQKRFLEFWVKHNPNPLDSNIALMEEYYSRVEFANRNYGGYMPGWKTDRGMILIRFGPPQNIERHPFDSDNKPYEVWSYYDENRQFIFVDESGFGDYRLLYPQTDLWGRIR